MANKPTILRAAGNNINQALNGAINSSTTTVILDDAGDCNASGGLLEIDYNSPTLREVIYYNSKSTHTLTVADDGRGLYGTTAQSHLDGALVRGFFVDDHINKLVDVVSNIEVSDLAADAVVTETDTITANDNDTTIPTSAAVKGYVDGVVRTGWTPAEETWTYSSVDDPTGIISVASDATTRFSAGMRIKFTNGGNTIYGIITAVAATTITFLHQIDPSDNLALVLMANSAITAPYFSVHKAPLGFPLDPLKWSVRTSDSTSRNQNTPTANTWYNLNGFSLSIPIGSWRIGYECSFYSTKNSNSFTDGWITLSTANNTQSDTDFTVYICVGGATGNQQIRVGVIREFVRTITSKQTRYLNIGSPNTGVTSVGLQNVLDPAVIYAYCAYL